MAAAWVRLRRRWVVSWFALAALNAMAVTAGPAVEDGVVVKREWLFRTGGGYGGTIEVSAEGTVDLIYSEPDASLGYAWQNPEGRWSREVVDSRYCDASRRSSARDSAGRLHVLYHAMDRQVVDPLRPYGVTHGIRDATGWTIVDTTIQGLTPIIVIGPDDTPIVLVRRESMYYIYRNENGIWKEEATHLSASFGHTRTTFIGDAQGAFHILALKDGYLWYATNAQGDWVEERLTASPYLRGTIAIDDGGKVHAFISSASLASHGDLVHARRDEAGWTTEVLLESEVELFARYADELISGGEGRLFGCVTYSHYVGVRHFVVNSLVYFDGSIWRRAGSTRGRASHAYAIALGSDGVVHMSGRVDRVTHSRFLLPDLAVAWKTSGEGSLSRAEDGGLRVSIKNLGPGRSQAASIGLYLSADAVLDSGDTRLDYERRLPSVGAGRERVVRLRAQFSEAAIGKYLFAVVDPDQRIHDTLDSNDSAGVLISE